MPCSVAYQSASSPEEFSTVGNALQSAQRDKVKGPHNLKIKLLSGSHNRVNQMDQKWAINISHSKQMCNWKYLGTPKPNHKWAGCTLWEAGSECALRKLKPCQLCFLPAKEKTVLTEEHSINLERKKQEFNKQDFACVPLTLSGMEKSDHIPGRAGQGHP